MHARFFSGDVSSQQPRLHPPKFYPFKRLRTPPLQACAHLITSHPMTTAQSLSFQLQVSVATQ